MITTVLATLTPLLLYSPPCLPYKVIHPPRHRPFLSQNIRLLHEVNRPPGSLLSPSQHPEYPFCLSTLPWSPLCDPHYLLPLTPCFLQNFLQGLPKLFICHPLEPPYLSPTTAHFAARLACTCFKYWSQSDPLRHSFLSSPYVGHLRLRSRRFLHYFRPGHISCPVC